MARKMVPRSKSEQWGGQEEGKNYDDDLQGIKIKRNVKSKGKKTGGRRGGKIKRRKGERGKPGKARSNKENPREKIDQKERPNKNRRKKKYTKRGKIKRMAWAWQRKSGPKETKFKACDYGQEWGCRHEKRGRITSR